MKNVMNWGGVLGLLLVIFSVILYLTDMSESPLTAFSHVLMIGVICFGIYKTREANGGFMSYGSGLGTGTGIALFAGIIVAAYTFIQLTYIDPDQMERLLIKIEDQLFASQMEDSQIDMIMGWYEKLFKPGPLAFFAVIGSAIEGFIISLIAAAIFQKKDPSFEANFK